MRKGISIEVTPTDRGRLQSIVGDRNSPQKHVWRARIVLLSASGEWNWRGHHRYRRGYHTTGDLARSGRA